MRDENRSTRIYAVIAARIVRQRWAGLGKKITEQPSLARFLEFSIACTLLNLFGLWTTQQSASAMFYFDSVGTALAAMVGGPTCGVITALTSSISGSFVIDRPEYAISGFTNMSCALAWGILPRLGGNFLGTDIFKDKDFSGYFTLISRVFILGVLCGIIASFVSLFSQISFFDLSSDISNRTLAAGTSGSSVSKNNLLLLAVIWQSQSIWTFLDNIYTVYFLSSLSSHIPDKIIATVTAATLAMSFLRTPNIYAQIRAIKAKKVDVSQFYNKKRTFMLSVGIFYIFLIWPQIWPFFGISYFFMDPWMKVNTYSLIFMGLFGLLTVFILPYRITLFKVVDLYAPAPSTPVKTRPKVSYSSDFLGSKLPFQRDVFEDTIKALTIAFALAQAFALKSAGIGTSGGSYASVQTVRAVIDDVSINASMPSVYSMITFNILLLTGFRYFTVMVLRLFGRF